MDTIAKFLPQRRIRVATAVKEEVASLTRDLAALQRWQPSGDGHASVVKKLRRLKFEHGSIGPSDDPVLGMPVVALADLRAVAEAIGWCIFPVGYLGEAHRPGKRRRGPNVLQSFGVARTRDTNAESAFACPLDDYGERITDPSLRMHVLAPALAYSLQSHVERTDAPMFVPSDMAQAFMALDMSLPMFRSIQRELRDQRKDIERLKRDMSDMAARVEALASAAARRRVEAAYPKPKAPDWSVFASWVDPVAVVFPRDATVLSDVDVWVGPAWGTVPDAVVDILKRLTRKAPSA